MDYQKSLLLLLFIIFFLVSPAFLKSQDNSTKSPFTIGSACDGTSAYSWETIVKSKWSTDIVVTLPLDVVDPDEWSSADAYRTKIESLLNGQRNFSSISNASIASWPDFAANSANLFVRFTRQISRSSRVVRCANSVWNIESETQSSESDFTDWIGIGTQPHFYSQTNGEDLAAAIEGIGNELNDQPGSAVTPFDVYTTIE